MEPVAIIGVGAILPDAPDAPTFWQNVAGGRYSISEVDPQRWDPALHYDPDPKAPDKTYSKIGGWVRDFTWEPLSWRLPIPPRVSDAMDDAQKWAIACTREVLADHGKEIDRERTAVIIGNAMAGEKHYQTALRIAAPEVVRYLEATPGFAALPADERDRIAAELADKMHTELPPVTEDTMPGELGNVMAGRVANLFDFKGPNYIIDAACASAIAAVDASVAGLNNGDFDTVVTGGIDRNNGASSFIKFCAIGALSATGTRPFDAGADGFVMAEGGALFLLKRLADAERDGDRIYAVIRGLGGASDGKGKGITAPNPVGQRLAVERAWRDAGLDPSECGMVEAHGTSTRVGDVVELTAINEAFGGSGLAPGSVALGSVKSNFGHLKAAAGSAGLLKTIYAIHHGQIPPSLNFGTPNPNVDWKAAPFRVNTELTEWTPRAGQVRTAGVSSFGFGGTNFHAVVEEYVPGRIPSDRSRAVAVGADLRGTSAVTGSPASAEPKAPLRGATVVGASDAAGLAARLREVAERAAAGDVGAPRAPEADDLAAPLRVAIDHADAAELADKAKAALTALDKPAMWKPLRARGVFHGTGPKTKVAFLYPGQGSQYVNMLAALRAREPIVAETIDHADRAMAKLLDRPLSSYFLVDADDPERLAQAELELRATEITQPAMLTGDEALTRMLAAYGIEPDMVMGHSLGEYAALVAAGSLTFDAALEAVSARGHEMASLDVGDPGAMAAVFAPLDEIQAIVDDVDGYVVLANVNSTSQSVVGGETDAVMAALAVCAERGFTTFQLPVSHAFHTRIVALASEPLRRTLERLELRAPQLPVVSNVTGSFYPTGADARERMLDLLADQVASPVQFVTGLRSLYDAGARVFVEVGPKRALQGLASDVLGDDEILSLFTNHPKFSDEQALNQALCGLYAAGHGTGRVAAPPAPVTVTSPSSPPATPARAATPSPSSLAPAAPTFDEPLETATMSATDRSYLELGRALGAFLERSAVAAAPAAAAIPAPTDGRPTTTEPVVIAGASIGLPGTERVFDDQQLARILGGQQFIGPIPDAIREAIADRHITRLVKGDDGQASFEVIDDPDRVIKLAARSGELDLAHEFGIDRDRVAALGWSTQLAIGAGVDALRDAGIPIVQHYRTTGIGSQLPDRWGLPHALRDDTGVIFASAFPGLEEMTDEVTRYQQDAGRRTQRDELRALRDRIAAADGAGQAVQAIDEELAALERRIEQDAYHFDRRFLFRVLSMGHSQFAELIGARGPNTQINSACASTTQAVALAEDWIRAGRCRRVVIVAADDASSDQLLPWIGAGFLASGAAATDAAVEDAALPFDRRRHGMLIGMGAAGIVVESAEAARERGVTPICEVLGSVTANSAFHGTRLDVSHIGGVMEEVIAQAEARGVQRHAIAPETVFVSHETYTPARGGSAAAEIHALKEVFGATADQIVIANTKGVTGHPMGVGVEDVVAIKTLETGLVPPVPNFRDVDPELGQLNLSRGGSYPVRYALRLAAGFGSQISMMLLRWTPVPDGQRRPPSDLGFAYRVTDPGAWQRWLGTVTGRQDAQLEVANRWLRVVDTGPAAQPAAPAAPAAPVAVPAASAPAPAAPIAVPASAAIATAPPAAPTAAPDVAEDDLEATVLALVAEQTGYPSDMLDLDLDLEADLGIDTVKQAELFVAVRETFDIERDDSLQLRDYPTLSHVIGFVRDRSPVAVAVAAAEAAPAADADPAAPVQDPVEAQILSLVADQTGYPSDMLDLDLDLEADLGIDTVKQAELFVAVRETYDIERDDSLQLRDYPTLAAVIGFVRERVPELAAATPAAPAAPAPAAPAPGAAAPAAPAPAAGSHAQDPVEAQVLALVAEQTGYPPEMLDLDLDLEADLGIDTVKQAELFVAVRETYDIERDDSLQLRDYPTLAAVIGFVRERVPELAAPAPSAPAADTSAPADADAPAAELAAATPAEGADDPVAAQILSLVVEQTGYPPEMLDLDLDLEADLGVDTVKQAELFVAVRETYGIERDDSLQLRDYPTLAHVIGFVRERAPQLAAPPAEESSTSASEEPTTATTVDAERFPRRVPVPVLRPPVSACVPTGVSLDEDARVVVFADHGGVADAVTEQLEEHGATVLRISDDPSAEELEEQLAAWREDGPIRGVVGLAGLDLAPFGGLDAERWHEGLRIRVKLLATAARALYDDLTAGAFFVTGTRLGGRFGYDAAGAQDVLGGAVSGFTKALAREREDATVKVVDVAPDAEAGMVAAYLLDEVVQDPGVIEVGYADDLRWSVGMAVEDITPDPDRALGPDDVFVVTGAAGSIVSAITADLAQGAGGGTFHLLDLTPAPDRDDPDLTRFVDDQAGLKQDLAARIADRGERATPAKVNQALGRIERSRAALDAVLAVEDAGGTAHWHQVDLTDGDAVGAAIAAALETTGRIDALVHAGGLEISHFLPDKPAREYDLVFDVKADGMFHCLHAIGDAPLGNLVVFSSIAGRFGNGGQTDYSAANDLLCKTVAALRTLRPDTRGVALDWTAWGGIGMATRGSIPKMMEFAGIDMLPPEIGVPYVRHELEAGGDGGEVVVAGNLGIMLDERHPAGGIDPDALLADVTVGPMLGRVVACTLADGLVTERELTADQPFLDDHRIDGTPVLPGVMSVESFAATANALVPDWHVTAIEDVAFDAPFKLYRDEPRDAEITARVRPGADGGLVAECRLVGRRTLANGSEQVTEHATGRVHLSREAPEPVSADVPDTDVERSVDADAVYRIYFHGPTYQVLARAWRDGDQVIGELAADLPPNHRPEDAPTVTVPRLLELCFQAAGVHELGTSQRMALPARIDRLELFGPSADQAPRYAVAQPTEGGADAEVVDGDGHVVLRMRGYGTVVLPDGPDEERIAPLRDAMQ